MVYATFLFKSSFHFVDQRGPTESQGRLVQPKQVAAFRFGIRPLPLVRGMCLPTFVSRLYDTLAYRVAHQACDLVNTQLAHESRAVRFGCFHTDAE